MGDTCPYITNPEIADEYIKSFDCINNDINLSKDIDSSIKTLNINIKQLNKISTNKVDFSRKNIDNETQVYIGNNARDNLEKYKNSLSAFIEKKQKLDSKIKQNEDMFVTVLQTNFGKNNVNNLNKNNKLPVIQTIESHMKNVNKKSKLYKLANKLMNEITNIR